MQCPKCDTENRAGAQFCAECGARLSLACAQCGTDLPPAAKFCDACGAQVAAPSAGAVQEAESSAVRALKRLVPKEYAERLLAARGRLPGERRTVTFLFCDIQGSTAMAETLDPEDVLDIMNGAFEVLIEPITHYEGTLARLMGDAILAFFGAPIAHDDDAQRAVLAALDIVAGAQQYAAQLEKERGISGFNVRVGIHTGLVVVGEVGSSQRVEYTAMGDAVNLAARLEQAAEPGTVLISEDTHRLVAPLFEAQALGPVEVKGRAGPVAVYRVLAARAGVGKSRGIPGLASSLVGREAEFGALSGAAERLAAGQGGIITLTGDAGIGKSRLVAEVRTAGTTHLPGALHLRWVEGRCLSYGASVAYLLWLDVLRDLLGVTLDDAPADVDAELRRRLLELCPDRFDSTYPFLARLMSLPLAKETEEDLEEFDGGQIRDHTFAALETLLDGLVQDQLLVVVCEDLHWADSISVQVLEHLLPLTTTRPLLLICVLRPVQDHRSWRLRETVARDHSLQHTGLDLEPLSPGDSEALVTNLLSAADLPTALRERILHRAEGNPFYLEEVIRSLIDTGALVQDQETGRWQATRDVATIDIPDTLQGVLLARIDRLQEDTRRVLQMAAVIGRIFLYRILGEISRRERDLDGQLLTLRQEEMVRQRAQIPELEYIFKHDLTREAAYNGLLKRHRRVYHRQVGEALEQLFPERLEEQLGLLAYHWERAGVADKAVDYLQRAGDQARLAYAHEEAVDYYRRALGFLRAENDYGQAARTLMKLGLTHATAFEYEAARQAYEEAFALSQQAEQVPPAAPLPPARRPLRVAGGAPIASNAYDPAADRSMVAPQLFSGLVDLTPAMTVVPDVARSWEVLDDGRTYVFSLRDDARWSDGLPVTAGDFEYAWKRVLHPTTSSEFADPLCCVKNGAAYRAGQESDPECLGVRALDDRTLRVELEEPTAYFLYLLASRAACPVPRHRVEALGQAWAEPGNLVTNGPFVVEACRPGESVVLARRPGYHGRFPGNLQRVEIFARSDPPDDLARYKADALDVLDLWRIPLAKRDRVREQHAGEYRSGPQPITFYIAFNTDRPPFDDIRVRRALALALDRPALAGLSLVKYGFPGTGGFVSPGVPGHSAGIALPYDPAQARRLLAAAGYPGGRGFPAIGALHWVRDAMIEAALDHWRENLGIEISLRWLKLDQFGRRLERDPPHIFESCWWADYPDPDSFLRGALTWAGMGQRDETFDTLVDRARRSTDQAERIKLYRQADRLLIDEARLVPTEYGQYHRLLKPWIKKYPVPAMGWDWTRFKEVIVEAD